MSRNIWIGVVLVTVVAVGGWYWYSIQPTVYVTPGGVTLLKVPRDFVVTADTLTWDTQTEPRGEHIELTQTNGARTLPYIIINLGPRTNEITAEKYIEETIAEINQSGESVLRRESIGVGGGTGYRLEVSATEDGASVRGYIVALDKGDMVYEMTAVARETEWATNKKTFEKIINSLILTRN